MTKQHRHTVQIFIYEHTHTLYLSACTWTDFGERRHANIPAKDPLPPTFPLKESLSLPVSLTLSSSNTQTHLELRRQTTFYFPALLSLFLRVNHLVISVLENQT